MDQVVAKIEEETDIELHRVENRGAECNVVRFYVSLSDYFKSCFCPHNLTIMQLLRRYFLMVSVHSLYILIKFTEVF